MKRPLPRAPLTRWSSNYWLLQTISMHQSDLRAAVHIMSENPDSWDNDTIMMTDWYDRWLSKASTCFLTMVHENIFIETDALFSVLQNKVLDIRYCCANRFSFLTRHSTSAWSDRPLGCARIHGSTGVVERMRQEFDTFYKWFEQTCTMLDLTVEENTLVEMIENGHIVGIMALLWHYGQHPFSDESLF